MEQDDQKIKKMRKETVDIIKEILESLASELVVDAVVANADGTFTLETKCTWWLTLQSSVTIDGNPFLVQDFVFNTSLIVSPDGGAFTPTVGSWTLPAPSFIHGTLKMANNDVDANTDKTILCPFVYLFEILRDKENTDEESMIERETDLRMFFLDTVDTADWLTEDHYKYFVYPMKQCAELFISRIKTSRFFTESLNYEYINLINVSEEGRQEKSIFDCNLSGVELRLFAEIREDLSCTNDCGCN